MTSYTQTRNGFRAALIDYDPSHFDVDAIQSRLEKFHLSLLKKPDNLDGDVDHIPFDDIENESCLISRRVSKRIHHRAQQFSARAAAKLGIDHLKKEDRDRLKSVLPTVSLSYINEASADAMASDLQYQFPWMSAATEHAWLQLRKSARNGTPVSISPLLLAGPPGIGKSAWSRALAKLLRAPHTSIDASVSGAGFSMAGTEKGWSTAQAGRPIELIIQHKHGGPVIVVDEICKASAIHSTKSNSVGITNTLLSLLEPVSARNFECPFHRVAFDLSKVSWILTANYIDRVSEPLKTRCTVVHCDSLSPLDLQVVASRLAIKACLDDPAREAALEAVAQLSSITKCQVDLRDVRRIIDRAEALQIRPLFH